MLLKLLKYQRLLRDDCTGNCKGQSLAVFYHCSHNFSSIWHYYQYIVCLQEWFWGFLSNQACRESWQLLSETCMWRIAPMKAMICQCHCSYDPFVPFLLSLVVSDSHCSDEYIQMLHGARIDLKQHGECDHIKFSPFKDLFGFCFAVGFSFH